MKKVIILSLILLGVLLAYHEAGKGPKMEPTPAPSQKASVSGESLLTETYQNPSGGYRVKLPKDFLVENNGENSVLIRPKADLSGTSGASNFMYISVVKPEFKKERVGEVYNYTPDQYKKLAAMTELGTDVNLAGAEASELGQWYAYTLVANEYVGGVAAKHFQNHKPWEFPVGTTEDRFTMEVGDDIYILGYYTGGDTVAQEARLDPRIAYSIIKSFELVSFN
jgi:hypothetical protein